MNSSLRCVIMEVLVIYTEMCGCAISYIVVCLFIEFSLYTKTCLIDIKTMFVQVSDLLDCGSPELSMLKCCKEAVDLHEQIYGYEILLFSRFAVFMGIQNSSSCRIEAAEQEELL